MPVNNLKEVSGCLIFAYVFLTVVYAPAVCMKESKGGCWGGKLDDIFNDTKSFLNNNRNEFVILNFSHFCNHPLSVSDQASQVAITFGDSYIYNMKSNNLSGTALRDLAGTMILLIEKNFFPEMKVFSSTTSKQSSAAADHFKRE